MDDAAEGLDQVARQRSALAGRVVLPWWYVVVYAVAMLAVVGLPLASWALSPAWSEWVVFLPAMLVLLTLDRLLGRVTGARLSRRTLRAYPSSRPVGLAMLAIVGVTVIGESVLLNVGQVAAAFAVVVVAVVALLGCLARQTAAIRDDIREGRATPA
jgi:hypothetical protein